MDTCVRRLIGDEEFVARRTELETQSLRLARRLEELARPDETIPQIEEAVSFSNYAAELFRRGDDDLKRLIVKTACSHSMLSNKILSIEAPKWMAIDRQEVHERKQIEMDVDEPIQTGSAIHNRLSDQFTPVSGGPRKTR